MDPKRSERSSIGALAARTGVSVRTLRFWSDEGLVPVVARTPAGYRLYGAEALARVELIVALRDLGFGHDAITAVLRGQETLADVARAHVGVLDHQIRSLERRRSVLRAIAARQAGTKEVKIMHALGKLTARERQNILDDLAARAFDGVAAERRYGIDDAMRALPPDLPDQPTPEQLDAWIELAELAADDTFVARIRDMAVVGAREKRFDPTLHTAVMEHAARALAEGVAPTSDDAKAVVDRIVPAGTDRTTLRDELARFTDARVERYWQLLGVLNGRPPFPSMVAPYMWLIEALGAHA